jgi:hypothetical protein
MKEWLLDRQESDDGAGFCDFCSGCSLCAEVGE